MNSSPGKSGKDDLIRAREADWYDQHYTVRDTAAARAQASENELFHHLGPWYMFALPHLRKTLTLQTRLLELGCGSGRMPAHLAREGLIPPENISGLDQSKVAVERASRSLPGAHFQVGDIYDLNYPADYFDIVMLMEVIEHLEHPQHALKQIWSVMLPGGHLYISFPNYVNPAWLAVRILAERLNRPNWIVLQPVDKIYTVWQVKKRVAEAGFRFEHGIGSNYGPPLLYRLERVWMTRLLNRFGLWWASFHPILVFQKPTSQNSSP